MPSFNTADAAQGLMGGVGAALQRMMNLQDEKRRKQEERAFLDEQRRQNSRDRLGIAAASTAGYTDPKTHKPVGASPMDQESILSWFQRSPEEQQGASDFLLNNPTLDRAQSGALGGVPNDKGQLVNVTGSGMGIPQTADLLREMMTARIMTRQPKPSSASGSGSYKEPPHRKVARQVLTDFAKTLGLTEDALRNKIRTDPATRARFKIQMQSAWRSGGLESQNPQQIEDHTVGVIGPG